MASCASLPLPALSVCGIKPGCPNRTEHSHPWQLSQAQHAAHRQGKHLRYTAQALRFTCTTADAANRHDLRQQFSLCSN